MKRFFVIAAWEFLRYLRSRTFVLTTFLAPVILAGLVMIPTFYLGSQEANQSQIGFVDFDSLSRYQLLSDHLAATNTIDAQVFLIDVAADTTAGLRGNLHRTDSLEFVLDSLNRDYTIIQDRRQNYFQQPASRSRTRRLEDTYQQLRDTRDAIDQTQIEYNRSTVRTDSMLTAAVISSADSLLSTREIEGYIILDSATVSVGSVNFHASQPVNFLRIQPLKQALQVMIVEARMQRDGVTVERVEELLRPLQITEILTEGSVKREFKFLVTYLAPLLVVIFLAIGIFTAGSFLYRSVSEERESQVSEYLLSSSPAVQLILGKLAGIGLLGGLQVLIWMLLTVALMSINVISGPDIGFLTLTNAGIFLLYFVLGYLLFASVFIGMGAVAIWKNDTQYISQLLKVLAVLPVVLIVLVFQSPDSLLVRILSFIPFLTPTFMVLRTPLGQPPMLDYYLSCAVLAVAIVVGIFLAIRLFRQACLRKQDHLSSRELLGLMQAS